MLTREQIAVVRLRHTQAKAASVISIDGKRLPVRGCAEGDLERTFVCSIKNRRPVALTRKTAPKLTIEVFDRDALGRRGSRVILDRLRLALDDLELIGLLLRGKVEHLLFARKPERKRHRCILLREHLIVTDVALAKKRRRLSKRHTPLRVKLLTVVQNELRRGRLFA